MTAVWGIVVHYGDAAPTLRCLKALVAGARVPDGIVVIDNAGGFRPSHGLPVDLVTPGRNVGFAGGIALGATHALEHGAELVWILNNDAVVDPACLGLLAAAAGMERDAGFLSPLVLYADSGTPWFAGGEVDRQTLAVHHHTVPVVRDRPYYTGFVTGCAMLVRGEVFERCGPPDVGLFMYFEDVDWCLRGHAVGLRSIVVPGACVVHDVARRRGRRVFSRASMYYMTRNRLLLGRRYGSRCGALPATLNWGLRQVAKGSTPAESMRNMRAVTIGLVDGWRGRNGPLSIDAGTFVA